MKQFKHEKAKLLQLLADESNQPQNKYLQQLKDKVQSLQSHEGFERSFRLSVREAKGLSTILQNALQEFEGYFLNPVNWIQSPVLREVAAHLVNQNIPITYYGRTWTKQTADWLYVDAVLEVEALQEQFQWGYHIQIHENLDPKSGTERGIIDTQTGEGIIGRLD